MATYRGVQAKRRWGLLGAGILVVLVAGISLAAAQASGSKATEYKEALKKKVSVSIDKSPGGERLTVQFAVIAVCKAAGVPYQWNKSYKLTDPLCRRFIAPVHVSDVPAQQAIADIVSPVGLTFSVDDNGVYLQKAPPTKRSLRPKAAEYKEALKKKVSVDIDRDPDGSRLTVQYAVIAVCERAGVPYQWGKSQKLTGGQCTRFIEPVRVSDVEAQKAIADIVSPVGLAFSVDDNGLYLRKATRAAAPRDEEARLEGEGEVGFRLAAGFQGEADVRIPAGNFVFSDLDGGKVRSRDFTDQILVMGVGMSWCAGCPPEGYALSKLSRDFQGRGVEFLYVNRAENFNTALDFAKYRRSPFPTLLCSTWAMPHGYSAGNPGIVIVDRQKKIRMRGTFTEVGIEAPVRRMLDDILEEQPAPRTEGRPSAGTRPAVKRSVAKPRILKQDWTPASLLSNEGTKNYQPCAAAANGGIWVAWGEDAIENGDIAVRHFDGEKWLPVEHSVSGRSDDYSPRLATDQAGNLWLAWVSDRGGTYGIWLTRFDGRKWQEPVMISAGTSDCYHPSLAVDHQGLIWTAWYAWSMKEEGGEEYHWRSIKTAHWDGREWSSPVEVTPFSMICVDHWDPEITVDATGSALLCWNQDNRNDPTIFSRAYREGRWAEGAIVSKPPKPEEKFYVPGRGQDYSPSVATLEDRSVWVFWQTYDAEQRAGGSGWAVHCAKWIDGRWSSSEQVSKDTGGNCRAVATRDRGDNLVAFWTDMKGQNDGSEIFSAQRREGKWEKPRGLVSGGDNINPATCLDKSGRVWVIWRSGGGGNWKIYATVQKEPS